MKSTKDLLGTNMSPRNLTLTLTLNLGNTMNVETGRWIHGNAGIGGGSDSYFEYLLKCYTLFGDMECWEQFARLYIWPYRHTPNPDPNPKPNPKPNPNPNPNLNSIGSTRPYRHTPSNNHGM